MVSTNPLTGIVNLGPKIITMLNSIGVVSMTDIKDRGSVNIYKSLQARYPEKTLPVCYYLYSLEGAIIGKYWDDIGTSRKQELLSQVR